MQAALLLLSNRLASESTFSERSDPFLAGISFAYYLLTGHDLLVALDAKFDARTRARPRPGVRHFGGSSRFVCVGVQRSPVALHRAANTVERGVDPPPGQHTCANAITRVRTIVCKAGKEAVQRGTGLGNAISNANRKAPVRGMI